LDPTEHAGSELLGRNVQLAYFDSFYLNLI